MNNSQHQTVSMGLRKKTMHGLLWSTLERFGTQGIQFAVGIILARLLAPEQFGLIAMLTFFTGIAGCFIDSGFGMALIRKKEPTQVDICSIFYFNIVISTVAWLLLCACSWWIADFYKQDILQPLVCAMGLTFVINSFGLIQRTLLTKRVDFKSQFVVSLPTIIASGIAGIVAAYYGLGVWALIIQQLTSSTVSTALLWVVNKWKPSLIFSFASLREMFVFGSRLMFSGMLNIIFNNIYVITIGKLFNADTLGYYSRAYSLESFPSANITNIVNRVAYPVFAQIHDDPPRLQRAMSKSLKMLTLFNAPMMFGMAVAAKPIVLALIGEKWLPCVGFLQLLCIIGFSLPLHVINLSALQAIGRSDLFLKLEIYKKILIVLNIVITYRWGVMAMIYGQLVTSAVSFLLNAHYSGKYLNYSAFKQMVDISPYILVTIPMVAMCYYLSHGLQDVWIMLPSQMLAGTVVWIISCRIVRLGSFMEIWDRGIKIIVKFLPFEQERS